MENPANEEVLAEVAEAGKEDIDEAVKAARKAFEEGPWSKTTPHQRTKYLLKVADLLEQNRDELAELSSLVLIYVSPRKNVSVEPDEPWLWSSETARHPHCNC